jgi:hypothetical protein
VFTLKVSRISDSVASRIDFPRAQPALLIRTVGEPRVLRTEEQASRMEVWEARSTWKYLTEEGAVVLSVRQDNLEYVGMVMSGAYPHMSKAEHP